MIECPNCKKQVVRHEFCYRCGYNIRSDENRGDNATPYLNVFMMGEEYAYIFSVNGKQVVIKSEDINDLKEKVRDKKFPWQEIPP